MLLVKSRHADPLLVGFSLTTCSLFAVDTWHLQLTVCVLGLLGTVRGVRGVRARNQWMPPPAERHAVQLPTPVVPVVPVGLAATRQGAPGGRVLLGAVSPMAQVKGKHLSPIPEFMPTSPATTAGTDSNETNETNEMDADSADMETFPEPDVETLEGDVQATLKMAGKRWSVQKLSHQQATHILVACHVLSSQRRLWGRKPDATWGCFLETLRRGRKNPVTPKLWVETSRWCAAHETKELRSILKASLAFYHSPQPSAALQLARLLDRELQFR